MEAPADETPTRVLVFAGEVDADNVAAFLREFTEVDASDGPIEVRINSWGGDAYGGAGLFDLLRGARNEVTTIAFGGVASAAFLFFQGGNIRIAAPNCTFLVHPTSSDPIEGQAKFVRAHADETERIHRRYCELVATRSGMPVETVQEMCSEETFLTSEEVLKWGLADAILKTR
jgi:ATP-dependent Clp protease protease subunit